MTWSPDGSVIINYLATSLVISMTSCSRGLRPRAMRAVCRSCNKSIYYSNSFTAIGKPDFLLNIFTVKKAARVRPFNLFLSYDKSPVRLQIFKFVNKLLQNYWENFQCSVVLLHRVGSMRIRIQACV